LTGRKRLRPSLQNIYQSRRKRKAWVNDLGFSFCDCYGYVYILWFKPFGLRLCVLLCYLKIVRLKKLRDAEHLCNNVCKFPSCDDGTHSQLLVERSHPLDVVVFLETLSPEFNRYGKAKSLLDRLFHPAKIQSDSPALNMG